MAAKFKMVGLVRFSVLTEGYYAHKFSSVEETAAHLFSPERMELRFRLFEKLCLPSLTRQSDTDFQLVVLTAESMPERYLSRLLDLLDPLPNVVCQAVGVDKLYGLLRAGYDSIPEEGESHRILFRLDDDDAVDGDFVRRTKKFAKGLLPLQGHRTPFILAYNRGFYLEGSGDSAQIYDSCERAPLSTGTSLVVPTGNKYNPYRFNHRKFAQHFNTFTDISVPSFVRTIHGDNKSNPTQMGLTHKWDVAKIEAALQKHFGFSSDYLRTL